MAWMLLRITTLMLTCALFQERPEAPADLGAEKTAPLPPDARTVDWKEGVAIPVRVPVVCAGREFMTTLVFPEETIETAITGWGEGDITAIQKRGLLFLRLTRKSEGQLNVIGGSGTHYLLYLKGIDSPEPGTYDAWLKIRRREETRSLEGSLRHPPLRPTGSLELLQAMREGLRPDGVRILRAGRELAYESPSIQVRLAYLYDAPSFRGYIYDVQNRTGEPQAVDASRLRGKGVSLILTALRDNVLEAGAATRLYAVTWKD